MSIRELLSTKNDAILGTGVSKEKIIVAESELGHKFSDEYVEYLSTVGLAMCDGHEFTGIGKSERTDVVVVTKQMRLLKTNIPLDWYVIEEMNIDGAVIWQNSEGHIFFNKKLEYNSLSEFLVDL